MKFAPRPQRTGRIAYRDDDSGTLWGVEDFRITREPDGGRTLAARCEMELGDDAVIRDCSLTVDAAFQPRDAHVRIRNHGRQTGSGWFSLGDDTIIGESLSDNYGRLSQCEPIERPLRGFGIHAVQADGWMGAAFPFDRGEGAEWFAGHNPIHSLHHLGATGPRVEFSTSGLRYEGEEEIEVPAGRFRCRRLSWLGMTNDHPPYVMWISTCGDALYVQGRVEGYMNGRFQLESLSGEPRQ